MGDFKAYVCIKNNSKTSDLDLNWLGPDLQTSLPPGEEQPKVIDFLQRTIELDKSHLQKKDGCIYYGNKTEKTHSNYFNFSKETITNSTKNDSTECKVNNNSKLDQNYFGISNGFYYKTSSNVYVRLNDTDPSTLMVVNADVTWLYSAQVGIVNQIELSADHYGSRNGGDVDDLRAEIADEFILIPNIPSNRIDLSSESAGRHTLRYPFENFYRRIDGNRLFDQVAFSKFVRAKINQAENITKPPLPNDFASSSSVAWRPADSENSNISATVKKAKIILRNKDGDQIGQFDVPYLAEH